MASRIQGITVEIGGDTTKLTTALKGVNSEIRNTQSQLRDVEKLLKLDPGNTELLAQRQRLLNEEVQATKEKLEALKTASEQANDALEQGTITQSQYDALQREIIATGQALEDLDEQAEQSAVALQKIASAGESLKSVGDKVTDAGKKMSVVSAGIVAAGTASTKMALDFEDAMAKVSTIADATEVPIDELEKAILDLSNQTGISSTEIADNVYNAISAGQSTGDAVNFVTNSTKLAKAGFADAGAALDILTTILNAYGMEASEVSNVSDMLIQTQNLGKTTVAELSSAMGKVIPTANAYGVKLDQLCAGYAIMTANGVATAESTTYMNSMLNELGKSGTKVSGILKEQTGQSFAQLMESGYSLSDCLAIINTAAENQGLAFGDMWSSSEAAKAGLILLGDSADAFNGTLAEMQNSTGATDTAFEKLKTNSYTIQVAINQLKNTAIELGNAIMSVLAPLLMSLAETISKLTAWFSGLSDGTKQFIVIIGMVVAAVGPVLIIVGKIMSAVGTIMTVVPKLAGVINTVKTAFAALNTTMLSNPIFLVIAAITALVAVFIYLWNTNEEFRQFWINLWENIKEVAIAVWTAIKEFFVSAWEAISSAAQIIWNGIKNFFSAIWEGIKTIFTTVLNVISTLVTTYFNIYKTIITTVFNAIKTVITTVLNSIKTVITTVWNTIKNVFTTVLNTIKSVVSGAFNSMWNGIKNTVSGIANTIKEGFNNAVGFIKGLASSAFSWGADMIMGIVNGIKSCIGKVRDAVSNVAETIRSYLHFSVPDVGPLTDYESWMPDFMSGLAKGIEQSKSMVAKAVDGVASDMVIRPHMVAMESRNVTSSDSGVTSMGLSNLTSAITDALSQMNGQSGDIVIPIYLGGTLLDETIVNAQQRMNLRSGGR
ncbi:phage tail tape measure protein [[Ruminococcus] torques]|uniref:phage tail tape measure protein n=1 Tax=[Ruminococcus] torques TaxID=33039 RepID=UPI003AB238D5